MSKLSPAVIFRLVCVTLLWVALAYLVLKTARMNFFTLFALIASGVVVFVPLYKKYFRNDGNNRPDTRH